MLVEDCLEVMAYVQNTLKMVFNGNIQQVNKNITFIWWKTGMEMQLKSVKLCHNQNLMDLFSLLNGVYHLNVLWSI